MYDLKAIKKAANIALECLLPGSSNILSMSHISGGSINGTFKIETDHKSYFIKVNNRSFATEMFEKEVLGLELLRQSTPLRIPEVVGIHTSADNAVLIMEWIVSVAKSNDYWQKLAAGMASLHERSDPAFGLDINNFIGSLSQSNAKHNTWVDFFIKEMLDPQVELAQRQHLVDNRFNTSFISLFSKLDTLIPVESPSLVHGDLWSGDILQDDDGAPVLIDPAVYYGHREMDIAFSKLFGGFPATFYEAYNSALPMTPGFVERADIYNLYPLLVHLNLFGKAYLGQINTILKHFT